ncbi:TRAP transporter substrate-binding protein [Mesorhizobium sp. CN2-181]|uniref:TRAP transporter substrate-binding protein n=1 Tax=Mesorhizobium yinganensis TaxID=3157707 RepID=UPI0032B718DC
MNMMHLRRTALIAICATTLTALTGLSNAEDLRLGSNFGDTHSSTRALKEVFAPKVEELTQGRHTASVFANSELGQTSEMVNQAQSGINFGVYVSTAFYNSQVPALGVTNLPFVFSDRETAFKVIDGKFGEQLKPQFEEKGLVILGFMELGFRHITNSKHPIVEPKGVAGLKIRLQSNPVHIATFELLGASPVALDGTEIFSGLSQGVVDGQENPYSVINNLRLYDAKQKYVSETGHFFDIIVFAGSKAVLDRMTPEDRAAVIEAGRLATIEQRRIAAEDEAANRKVVAEKGVEITVLTPEQREAFRAATAPVYDQVRGTLGKELVDSFLAEVAANE